MGVLKLKCGRMKAEPFVRVGASAILFITNNRMAALTAVHADLVFSPRLQLQLQKGVILCPVQHAVVRHGPLAPLRNGSHVVVFVFNQAALPGTRIACYAPFDKGVVCARDGVLFKLLF